jgi:hypothetical protein
MIFAQILGEEKEEDETKRLSRSKEAESDFPSVANALPTPRNPDRLISYLSSRRILVFPDEKFLFSGWLPTLA